MFSTNTRGLPACSDIAVDKNQYRVVATVLGETPKEFFTELISASSAAHAALLAGVIVMARVNGLEMDLVELLSFTHNIRDHVRVTVTRI